MIEELLMGSCRFFKITFGVRKFQVFETYFFFKLELKRFFLQSCKPKLHSLVLKLSKTRIWGNFKI